MLQHDDLLDEHMEIDMDHPAANLSIDIKRLQKEDKEDQLWATDPVRQSRMVDMFKKIPFQDSNVYCELPVEILCMLLDEVLKDPFTNEHINKEQSALALNGPQLRAKKIHPKFAPFLKCDGTLLMAPYGALSDYTNLVSPSFQMTVNLIGSPFHSLADKVLREANHPYLEMDPPLEIEADYYHQVDFPALEVRAHARSPSARRPLASDRPPRAQAAFRNMADFCAIALKKDKHGHLKPKVRRRRVRFPSRPTHATARPACAT